MDMFESIILAVKVAVTKKCAEKYKSNNERMRHNDDNCGIDKGLAVGIGKFSSIWACFADCSTLDSNEAGEGMHSQFYHDQGQGRGQQGRCDGTRDGGAGLGTSWDKVPHLEVTSLSSKSGSSPLNNRSSSQKINHAEAVIQGQSQGQTNNYLTLNRGNNSDGKQPVTTSKYPVNANYENYYDDQFNKSNQERNNVRNEYAKIGF